MHKLIGFFITCALVLSGCASKQILHPRYGQDCESLQPGGLANNVDCVRVYYGTNRQILLGTPDNMGTMDLAVTDILPKASAALTLGRADIWLPKLVSDGGVRDLGETPFVTGKMPEDEKELSKYVFITRITKNGKGRFTAQLGADIAQKGNGAALLFIHGFNVGFDSALIRSAQLSIDLAQNGVFNPGTPVLFSWPSAGKLLKYKKDRETAEMAAPFLTEFLDILTNDVAIKRINIIAHSMGNRVLIASLETYASAYLIAHPDKEIEFRIILAAADVERGVFDLVTGKLQTMGANVTIYTSDDDLALTASKIINGALRLGDTNKNKPYIRGGFDTVDATPVATELFGLGHGYYSENPFILGDILCALAGAPSQDRALGVRHYDDIQSAPQFLITDPKVEPMLEECSLIRKTSPNRDPEIGFGYGGGSGGGSAPPPVIVMPPPQPSAPPPVFYGNAEYEFGVSDLTGPQKGYIKDLASFGRPISYAVIYGYASTAEQAIGAADLAEARAATIAGYLVEIGVDPAVITTASETITATATDNGQRASIMIQYE